MTNELVQTAVMVKNRVEVRLYNGTILNAIVQEILPEALTLMYSEFTYGVRSTPQGDEWVEIPTERTITIPNDSIELITTVKLSSSHV